MLKKSQISFLIDYVLKLFNSTDFKWYQKRYLLLFFQIWEKIMPVCSELQLRRFLCVTELEAQPLYDEFSSIML